MPSQQQKRPPEKQKEAAPEPQAHAKRDEDRERLLDEVDAWLDEFEETYESAEAFVKAYRQRGGQ